jgi:hypothetical protein
MVTRIRHALAIARRILWNRGKLGKLDTHLLTAIQARQEAKVGVHNPHILLNSGAAPLLLFENLNHTGVVARSVLAAYDAIKAFAVFR